MNELVVWKSKQLMLMEIMARGQRDEDGEKITIRAIAKKLGVSRKTIFAWKKLDGFAEATYDMAMKEMGGRLPMIAHAMGDEAEGGDVPAARFDYEVCGKLNRQREMIADFEALFVALKARPVE
jgi:AcrR family transcriptional regulator